MPRYKIEEHQTEDALQERGVLEVRNYTGIDDIDGNEIYEGDTVSGRAIVGIFWKDVVGKVILSHGCYAVYGGGCHQDLWYVNNLKVIRD